MWVRYTPAEMDLARRRYRWERATGSMAFGAISCVLIGLSAWRGWGNRWVEVRPPIPFLEAFARGVIAWPILALFIYLIDPRNKSGICSECRQIGTKAHGTCACGGEIEPSHLWKWVPDPEVRRTMEGLPVRLENTVWEWWMGETLALLPNGVAEWNSDPKQRGTWKLVDPTRWIVEGAGPQVRFRLVIDANLQGGILTEGPNPKRSVQLLSPSFSA